MMVLHWHDRKEGMEGSIYLLKLNLGARTDGRSEGGGQKKIDTVCNSPEGRQNQNRIFMTSLTPSNWKKNRQTP